jgi:hypothetical protein
MLRLLLFGQQGNGRVDGLARRLDRADLPFDMVCHDRRAGDLRSAIGGGSLPLFIVVGSGTGAGVVEALIDDGIADVAAQFRTRSNGPALQRIVTSLQIASNWQVVPLPVVVGTVPTADPGFGLSVAGLVAVTGEMDRTRAWRWDHKC